MLMCWLQVSPTTGSLLANALVSWQWDAFAFVAGCHVRPLATLSLHLLRVSGLVEHFGLPLDSLAAWLGRVEEGYSAAHPYHNAIHAADVLQVCVWWLGERAGEGAKWGGVSCEGPWRGTVGRSGAGAGGHGGSCASRTWSGDQPNLCACFTVREVQGKNLALNRQPQRPRDSTTHLCSLACRLTDLPLWLYA
jgi:hypothetical protein